jgi:hypothetical protein
MPSRKRFLLITYILDNPLYFKVLGPFLAKKNTKSVKIYFERILF